MGSDKRWRRSKVRTADFEAYGGQVTLEGDLKGRVHWLHRVERDGARIFSAGVFVAQPSVSQVTFDGQETLHVLDGTAEIEIDGETLSIEAGDIVTFDAGSQSVWRITAPLTMVFVEAVIEPCVPS